MRHIPTLKGTLMTVKLSTFACVTVTTFLLGTTLAAISAAKTYSDMYNLRVTEKIDPMFAYQYKHYWKLF